MLATAPIVLTPPVCPLEKVLQEQNPTMQKTNVLAVLVAGTGFIGMGIVPTPLVAAAQDLSSFVGKWSGHERNLVILQTGSGHLTYADEMACPSCSEAEAPAATVDFTLTSVSDDVATGRVDASSDQQNAAVGSEVTARLAPGFPSGQILQVSVGRLFQFFCNETSVGQCGA
jgi:hypothetical protein